MERLEQRSRRRELSLVEIVQEVLGGGSDYKESTVRTHITSSMRVDAPANLATRYRDLRRVDRGVYKRI